MLRRARLLQVGGSVTLGEGTTFVGTAMALTAITVHTGTTVTGWVLARNGAVALDASTITRADLRRERLGGSRRHRWRGRGRRRRNRGQRWRRWRGLIDELRRGRLAGPRPMS
ncbi:ice-binding family protein [Pseudonocardia sp.]|uniref:ice-binding family protein n=1 Tax=Pseudonocardia sp. TaxID=60912 RepID=UPI0026154AAC|nr:ice-binding family protein [Pseudonocardia sp.]